MEGEVVEPRQRAQLMKGQSLRPTMRAFLRTKPLYWVSTVPFAPFAAIEVYQKVPAVLRQLSHETWVAEVALAEEALAVEAVDIVDTAVVDTVVAVAWVVE